MAVPSAVRSVSVVVGIVALVVVPAITAAIPVSAIGPGPGLAPIVPELPVLTFGVLVAAVLIFAVLVLPDSISTEVVVAIRVVASSGSASMVCHGC